MLLVFCFCFSGSNLHFCIHPCQRMCGFMESYCGHSHLLASCWAQESGVWGDFAVMSLDPSKPGFWVGSGYFTFLGASVLWLSLKAESTFIRFSDPSPQWPLPVSGKFEVLTVAGLGVLHSLSSSITLFMLSE